MKSLILSFFLAFAGLFSLSAQGNIPQPTHEVTQIAFGPSLPFNNSDETYNYYSNDGYLYESKTNAWDGANWVLDQRIYYTLNAAGKPTTYLRRKWDAATSSLIDNSRATFGYHTDGQENYRKDETWSAMTGTWETEAVNTTTFTPSNKILVSTSTYYDAGLPLYGSRNNYSYDGADRVSTRIVESFDSGVWMNNEKVDYIYNGASTDFAEADSRYWNEPTSTWSSVLSRDLQTVTNTQQITLTEHTNGSNWFPSSRNTLEFDANHQLLSYYAEGWDDVAADWTPQVKFENIYNNDQSIAQFKYYIKDFDTGLLYAFAVVDYDYETYAVSTQHPVLAANVSVSPNPTADFLQIEVANKEASNITLLDLHGKVVAQAGTESNRANLSLVGQPAGIYLLLVEQGGAVKMIPVVKN